MPYLVQKWGWKALLYQVTTPLSCAFASKIVLNSKLVAQQSYDNISDNLIKWKHELLKRPKECYIST